MSKEGDQPFGNRLRGRRNDLDHSPSGKISEWITFGQVAMKLPSSVGSVAIMDGNGGNLVAGEALCVFSDQPDANGTVNHKAPWPLSNGTSSSTPDGRFYAVLIDIDGNIVGISSVSSVSGGAVSNGCWQSFGGMV